MRNTVLKEALCFIFIFLYFLAFFGVLTSDFFIYVISSLPTSLIVYELFKAYLLFAAAHQSVLMSLFLWRLSDSTGRLHTAYSTMRTGSYKIKWKSMMVNTLYGTNLPNRIMYRIRMIYCYYYTYKDYLILLYSLDGTLLKRIYLIDK